MTDPAGEAFASLGDLYLKSIATMQSATGTDAARGMTQAIADAWRIAAASALRYGQGLMAVQLRYQAGLLQAMTDRGSDANARIAADDLRGFLREIGETALLEARRLQMELDQLGETIARATAKGAVDATARRPYRAKD